MKNKSYAAIDIFKFAFAILIVMLHSQQKSNLYPSIYTNSGAICLFTFQLICRLAVPFFFITSSYFLFKDNRSPEDIKHRVFKYCKRILLLYVVWFVLNSPYILIAKLGFPNEISFDRIMRLFRDILFYNAFPSSWYLTASFSGALIIWFLSKNGKNKWAIIVSVACYLICLLMTCYNFFVNNTFNLIFIYINKIFYKFYISFPYGLLYFVLGKLLAENEERINIKTGKLFIMFVISLTALFFELFVITYKIPGFVTVSHTTYIMLPIVSLLLVILCLRWDISYKPSYMYLRKSSTIIYCSHGFVLWIMYYILQKFNFSLIDNFVVLFFTASLLCIGISFVIIRLSKKFDKLKYLY